MPTSLSAAAILVARPWLAWDRSTQRSGAGWAGVSVAIGPILAGIALLWDDLSAEQSRASPICERSGLLWEAGPRGASAGRPPLPGTVSRPARRWVQAG